MHFKGLDLNLLVVLDVLLTEQNTTRAGEKLYLSQPAVSGALSRLREYFGDQLLVPSGQKMILTALAQRLAGPVRSILKETEALISSTTVFDPASSTRSFTLNMSDTSATLILSSCLQKIRELAPAVHMEFITYHERVPEIIEQGEVDFLVVPETMASAMHPAETLYEDGWVCIAWSGNKFLKKGLSKEQLLSLGHVTTRNIRRKEHLGELLFHDIAVKPRFELIVPALGLVPISVIHTDLIAVVNQRIAAYYAKYLPLKVFPLPIEVHSPKAMLQWNRYHDNDQGTQWMRRTIIDHIKNL